MCSTCLGGIAMGGRCHLHLGCNLVTAQSHAPDRTHRPPPPTHARCPTEEVTVHWESIVAGNLPTVETIFAGAVCALTHWM